VSAAKLDAFVAEEPDLGRRGVTADLLAEAARHATLLLFIDPGRRGLRRALVGPGPGSAQVREREEQDANLRCSSLGCATTTPAATNFRGPAHVRPCSRDSPAKSAGLA
jgi:hypothetical protein